MYLKFHSFYSKNKLHVHVLDSPILLTLRQIQTKTPLENNAFFLVRNIPSFYLTISHIIRLPDPYILCIVPFAPRRKNIQLLTIKIVNKSPSIHLEVWTCYMYRLYFDNFKCRYELRTACLICSYYFSNPLKVNSFCTYTKFNLPHDCTILNKFIAILCHKYSVII